MTEAEYEQVKSNQSAPDARNYRHVSPQCGRLTTIDGGHFRMLSNPFAGVRGTFCAGCRRYDKLTAFRWEDTGEVVAEQRIRLGSIPWLKRRYYGSTLLPTGIVFLGILIGLGAGVLAIKIQHPDGVQPGQHDATALIVCIALGAIAGSILGFKVSRRYAVDHRFFK